MLPKYLVSAVLTLALLAGACSSKDAGGSGENAGLTGSISIDGSSTVGPITEAIAEEFNADAPDVEVAVGISGTGGGFEKFCAGETDISDASRPIKEEEIAACEDNGVEYVELEVALDGLAVVTHADVDWIDCVTFDQLKAIWDAGSDVGKWSDLDPAFPETDLQLFGPGTDSGTFDYFTKEINGEEGRSRTDYTPSEDDNVLVRGIEGTKGALGYFGIAYFEQNSDKLKDLSIDIGDGTCVEPTTQTVQSGEYPLSRPLYIYVAVDSLARPEVAAFVDLYLEAVEEVVGEVGYVALPQAALDASVSAWEQAAS